MRVHAYYLTGGQKVKKGDNVNSFQLLFDLVGVLGRRRFQTAERCFAALGLNHTEARLLSLLRRDGVASQESLSSSLFVDRTNVGRALKSLEQQGLIVRRSDDSDKRANLVEMTPKGRKVVVEISKSQKKMAQTFFGDLSEAEASAIVQLLKRAIPDEDYDLMISHRH